MGQPVGHFEIIGANPEKLRSFYGDLYVGVPDVEAALRDAQRLGGTRRMGPEKNPGDTPTTRTT